MGMGAATVRLALLSEFSPAAEAEVLTWLNRQERDRLALITAPTRRRQFLAGHGLARRLAAAVGGGEAAAWGLCCGPHGAPILLAPKRARCVLSVSLSHRGDWVGCAIAGTAIGLDLEVDARPRDFVQMAKLSFSPDENTALQKAPLAERSDRFYTYWTLKEAQAKYLGTGWCAGFSRQQTFRRCSAETAQAINGNQGGLHWAVFGEPGLRVQFDSATVDLAESRCWSPTLATADPDNQALAGVASVVR